jgi:sugar/nucleoside kinase (ribokinase family)
MKWDISVVGPLNIDLLITGDGPPNWEALTDWVSPATMEMTAAGAVGYTVQNLARLGLKVAVSSCLPDDPLGAFVLDALKRDGVGSDFVQQVPETVGGMAVYTLLFGSHKRPLTYRLPSHDLWPLRYTPAEVEALLQARLLHNGGYLHFEGAWHGFTVELFQEAKARGLITTMDPQFPLFAMEPPWLPALADILPFVDLLLCDETEARNITDQVELDEAARRLLEAGPKTVVIKQGPEGSTVYRPDYRYTQPAVKLGEVVDSIGAGDAYDAAFLLGTLEGWSLERRARFASIAAGFTVTGVGGSQTMPSRAQIEAKMGT